MPLKIICGPTGAGKTTRAIEAFIAAMRRGDNPVFIAPTGPDARHFEREMLRRPDCRVVSGARVTTFDFLTREILSSAHAHARIAGATERQMILDEVISHQRDELRYLGPSAAYDGFANSLGSVIAELQLSGISPVSLAEAGKEVLAERRLNQELFCLYAGYQEALRDRGLLDYEGAQRKALDALRGNPALLRHASIIVDGFWDFTPWQHDFLASLAAGAAEVLVTLPLRAGRAASQATQHQLDLLSKYGEATMLEEPVADPRPPALRRIDAQLFDAAPPAIDAAGAVGVIEGAGTRGQAELVAAEILRLCRRGEHPDGIAVVCHSVTGPDVEAIVSVMREYHIPYDHQAVRRLGETAVGRLAVAALDSLLAAGGTVRDGLGLRHCMLACLRNPLSGAPGEPVDRWARELSLKGIDDEAGMLREWNRLAPGSDALKRLLDLRNSASDMAGLAGGIYRLAEEAVKRSAAGTMRGDAADERAADERAEDLLALKSLGGVCSEARQAGGRQGAAGLAGAKLLRRLIVSAEVDYKAGTRRNCVRLLDPHRALNQRFDTVFVCGLLEKQFPALGREDAFISTQERQRLKDGHGLMLETGEYRLEEERFLFHRTMSRADKKVYLCYPYCDPEGKETVRSLFVDETLELFDKLREDDIRLRRISEVVFAPDEAPTTDEALRSLCLIAGEHTYDAGKGPSGKLLEDLRATAAGGGIEDRLNRSLGYYGQPAFAITAQPLLDRFQSSDCFSATSLEKFAGCPFRYFVDVMLQPAPMELDEDAMLRGNIAHEVLARLGAKVGAHKEMKLAGADRKERQALKDMIDDMVDKKMIDMGDDVNARLLRATLTFYLHRFIDQEASFVTALRPAMCECSFGGEAAPGSKGNHNELFLNLGDGVKLAGKIDRIDIVDISAAEKVALVIDYKMSPKATCVKKFADEGKVQIPLYILAAREIWDLAPVGGQYYALMNKNKTDLIRGMCLDSEALGSRRVTDNDKLDPDAFEAELEHARERALACARRIQQADFAPAPLEEACKYCQYGTICRHKD